MENISMHSHAIVPGGHWRLQAVFSLLHAQQSREGGFLTESNNIVAVTGSWTWCQYSEKLLSPFLGVFLPKEKKLWKVKTQSSFYLAWMSKDRRASTHLKDKGCWCYWALFILLMKSVTCAGWHLMLPYPKLSWRCCWGMNLHWKQLHNSSWKIFAGESTDHSSQQTNWCFVKITGPYPWLYLCLIWLGRFIWHLDYEFPVWRSISIAEAFRNSPGVWQESWVLWGLFVAPTLWTVLAVGECCSVPVPENVVYFIVLSSSLHTAHLVSQVTNTCSAEEFLCELQSLRNSAWVICSWR